MVSSEIESMVTTVQVSSRKRNSNCSWISWRRLVEIVAVEEAKAGGSIGKGVVCIFQGVMIRGYDTRRVVIADILVGAWVIGSIDTGIIDSGIGIEDGR